MKRLMALVLTLVLALSLSSAAMAEAAKPQISYWALYCGTLDPGSYVETFVEDALGIDVVIRKVAHTDTDAINLMITSGEMPDCGWFSYTYEFMNEQELIRGIPVDMVKEYAPSLIKFYDENPIFYAIALDPNDNTQFRYFPDAYDTYLQLYVSCQYMRYDWIEAPGLDLGDVKVEQVADNLYIADKGLSKEVYASILDAFVNQDPDQNGQNDTIGLVNGWQDLRTAFGIIASNMEYEGKVVEWYTHPNMKDFLLYAQDLYARGLIHPEIFTLEGGAKWELINKGMSGVHAETSTNALNAWASNRPPLSLYAANPDAKLLMFPGVADDEGHTPRLKAYSAAGSERFFINADVTDDKLIEILKMYEFCNFSGDDQTMATLWYGEEGVDWEWQGEKPVKISEIQSGDKGTMVFCRNMQLGKLWGWLTFEPLFEAGKAYYIKDEGGAWNDDLAFQYKLDIFSQTDAAKISGEYNADWTNVRNAYFMAVVMGEKNVESDWDAYIKELMDLRYGDYLEELEKAPAVEEIIAQFAG